MNCNTSYCLNVKLAYFVIIKPLACVTRHFSELAAGVLITWLGSLWRHQKDGCLLWSNAAPLNRRTVTLSAHFPRTVAADIQQHASPECRCAFGWHEDLLRQSQPDHGSSGLGGGEWGVWLPPGDSQVAASAASHVLLFTPRWWWSQAFFSLFIQNPTL